MVENTTVTIIRNISSAEGFFFSQSTLLRSISLEYSDLKINQVGIVSSAAANQQPTLTVAPASAATVWPQTVALCPAHVITGAAE